MVGSVARVNTSGRTTAQQSESKVNRKWGVTIKPQGLGQRDCSVAKVLACNSSDLTPVLDPIIPPQGGRED